MISYKLHGYNSITLVILYMTNNIYIRALIYDHSTLHSAYPATRSYHKSTMENILKPKRMLYNAVSL